ncbi:hypothetical protein [Nitrosarchaeum sp. AC2]|uniref:hypothetical protein n=1 Tax=Nitrosarchaeum sp. AC2 TaxID=2259673 RepID=UPI0015C72F35|nr:hypothetical protein [Nitrosarchaeum sp. AC2]
MTRKNAKLLSMLTMLGVMSIGITPAFAASSVSTGPWSTLQEIPSYTSSACTFSDDACADATTTGDNSLVSRGDNFVWNVSTARNNMSKSPNTQGSLPELTTSATPVKYKFDIDYDGDHTVAAGHLGWYEYGADIMKKSGSDWVKVTGCYFTVSGDGAKSGTPSKTCQITNSGTNTYQMGTDHETVAPAYLFGSTDVIDYYSGSYHANTDRLEICTSC